MYPDDLDYITSYYVKKIFRRTKMTCYLQDFAAILVFVLQEGKNVSPVWLPVEYDKYIILKKCVMIWFGQLTLKCMIYLQYDVKCVPDTRFKYTLNVQYYYMSMSKHDEIHDSSYLGFEINLEI